MEQEEIAENGEMALRKSQGRIVILGAPGLGKSTLLKQLIVNQAQQLVLNNKNATQEHIKIPIFIMLPDFARSKKSLRKYLKTQMREQFIDVHVADVLWDAIKKGNAFICLDSLDEVMFQRNQLVQEIKQLIRGSGKHTVWVISSRYTDYMRGQFGEGHLFEWELLALDEKLRERLAHKLIPEIQRHLSKNSAKVTAPQFLEALAQHARINTWGQNPLLFSLAAILFVYKGFLPLSRRALYLEVIDTIIQLREISTWEISSSPLGGSIARHELIKILAAISYQLFIQQKGRTFLKDDLLDILEELKKHEQATWEVGIVGNQIVNTGLIERVGRDVYTFLHQTFQEYLGAYHISLLSRSIALEEIQMLLMNMNEPFVCQLFIELAYISHEQDEFLENILYQKVTDLLQHIKETIRDSKRELETTQQVLGAAIDIILMALVDIWGPRYCKTLIEGNGEVKADIELASSIGAVFERSPRKFAVPALRNSLYKYPKKARFIGALGNVATEEAQLALFEFTEEQLANPIDPPIFFYLAIALGNARIYRATKILEAIRDNPVFDSDTRVEAHTSLVNMGVSSSLDEEILYDFERIKNGFAIIDTQGRPADWSRIERRAKWISMQIFHPRLQTRYSELLFVIEEALAHPHDIARIPIVDSLGDIGNNHTFLLLLQLLEDGRASGEMAVRVLLALRKLVTRSQVDISVRRKLKLLFAHIHINYPFLAEEIETLRQNLQKYFS